MASRNARRKTRKQRRQQPRMAVPTPARTAAEISRELVTILNEPSAEANRRAWANITRPVDTSEQPTVRTAADVVAETRQQLGLTVTYRDPDEPPIFAQLLTEVGGLPDPPGTVWGQPADLSRRGLAASFLELWPTSRSALMAVADRPTLADDPGPALPVDAWAADELTEILPQLEVAHA